jgi:hypothetical protein
MVRAAARAKRAICLCHLFDKEGRVRWPPRITRCCVCLSRPGHVTEVRWGGPHLPVKTPNARTRSIRAEPNLSDRPLL